MGSYTSELFWMIQKVGWRACARNGFTFRVQCITYHQKQMNCCAAVGQTQLLLRTKFIQFHDLINKCEKSLAGETEKPVTFSDFQGFLDMLLIQVENVYIRFDNLKKLKSNNWTEETETENLGGKHPLTRGSKEKKSKASLVFITCHDNGFQRLEILHSPAEFLCQTKHQRRVF